MILSKIREIDLSVMYHHALRIKKISLLITESSFSRNNSRCINYQIIEPLVWNSQEKSNRISHLVLFGYMPQYLQYRDESIIAMTLTISLQNTVYSLGHPPSTAVNSVRPERAGLTGTWEQRRASHGLRRGK